MNWRRFSWVFTAVLFLSCTKENWTEERMAANMSLLDIYYSPALFRTCDEDAGTVTFGFSDGSSVEIADGCIPVHTASDGDFPDVRLKNGEWEINGRKSGIKFSEGYGNRLSKIVCLAYDCNALRL